MSATIAKQVEASSEKDNNVGGNGDDSNKQFAASLMSMTFPTSKGSQGEANSNISAQYVGPVVDPKECPMQSMDKKKGRTAKPALKVLTTRNKNFSPSQSRLNTPATDFTPFHSPADPLKLNSDGPNWHLFNKKVADSLDKLTQLRIQDDKDCNLAKECSRNLALNIDSHNE